MHTEPSLTICVRHRVLGWVPGGRWHFHMSKPVHALGSTDFELLDELRSMRWWVVAELGTTRDTES